VPQVCVVGAALIDLVAYVPRLPAVGETLHGSVFCTGFGGKGANQAAMAAKLGARVSMVTRVGRDTFGDSMLENFHELGIDTTHVGVDESTSSGVAPIAVDANGDNAIVIVTGANDHLTPADAERARETIAAADVLVCQLEIPHDVTLAALSIAREESTLAILNPAPAAKDLPGAAFELADVLCPNESEAALILGREVEAGTELPAARELRSLGARAVVITLGERGYAISTDDLELISAAEPVAAVDTTGAGDAFVGTLAVGLALGEDLATAAARANHMAAMSVRLPGTQSSFPSVDLV
jgi:ribokinase